MFFILTIILAITTLCSAGYVIYTGGTANPGLALLSLIASLWWSQAYRSIWEKEKEKQKLISSGVKTTGKVTDVQKCCWIKINTKAFRKNAFDGANFPHIIYFTYIVNDIEYSGKKYINCYAVPPENNMEIEVYYDSNNHKIYIAK